MIYKWCKNFTLKLILNKFRDYQEINPEPLTYFLLQGIFPSMKIEELLTSPESKTLEFKENSKSLTNILKTLISFANTSGGILIIGISDKDKSLVGLEDPMFEVEKIANIISDSIAPKIVPNIDIVPYRNKYLLQSHII